MQEVKDYHKFNQETIKALSEFYGVDLSKKPIMVNFGSHSADYIREIEPKLDEIKNKIGNILYSKFKNMQEVRRNEFKDLLEMNELMFVEHTDFIKADIPEFGSCTYYPKKNRLNIHKGNKWESDGFYFVKNHLAKEKVVIRCYLGEKSEVVDMKPEQLRKGNLLKNQMDGSLITVKSYDIYCLEEGMDSMIMQPIPITDDWVNKFGFIRQRTVYYKTFCKLCHKSKTYFTLNEATEYQDPNELHLKDPKTWWTFPDNKHGLKIKYVHELQNLYFSLTGEELTLK